MEALIKVRAAITPGKSPVFYNLLTSFLQVRCEHILLTDKQGRRENSRGLRQNIIRGLYDVIIFKQQD